MPFARVPVPETVGFATGKMKRKDLEDVFSEFSEFSLSSPARKIRRLSLELHPIFEEEGQQAIEAEPPAPQNEEKALVLYKPVQLPSVDVDASNVSIKVDCDLFFGSRDRMSWPYCMNQISNDEPSSSADKTSSASKLCLAVIPWVPPDQHEANGRPEQTTIAESSFEGESMDVEGGDSSMDVEEEQSKTESCAAPTWTGMNTRLHQWQQLFMDPLVPTNPASSVMSSW